MNILIVTCITLHVYRADVFACMLCHESMMCVPLIAGPKCVEKFVCVVAQTPSVTSAKFGGKLIQVALANWAYGKGSRDQELGMKFTQVLLRRQTQKVTFGLVWNSRFCGLKGTSPDRTSSWMMCRTRP